METPPELPTPPPPTPRSRVGRVLTAIVAAPIVLLGAGMAYAAALHEKNAEGYFALVLVVAGLCSIAAAVMICSFAQSTIGRIFLFILSGGLLMVLYTTCIFAGCSAVSGPMNFR